MRLNEKRTGDKEIWIYQNLWKNLLMAIGCLAFAAGGYSILQHNTDDSVKPSIVGWMTIIFFGGGGLFVLAMTIYNRIKHIPLLIIYADRVDMYIHRKRTYQTFRYEDLEGFHLTNDSNLIIVDYKEKPLVQKFEQSSSFTRKLMSFNASVTGGVEAIPAGNLTMKARDICDILNERLKKF